MSKENRNFGCGDKLNTYTIHKLAETTREALGHSSAYAIKTASALKDFAAYLRNDCGLRDMAAVTREQYEGYARDLHERLNEGDLSPSSTSTYLSCINKVYEINDRPEMNLSASEYGISRGERFPNTDRAMSTDVYQAVLARLQEKLTETGNGKYQTLAHSLELQHDFGLRARESMQIKIGEKALNGDKLDLVKGDGMKNGRPREATPISDFSAAHRAQEFVHGSPDHQRNSLIPDNLKYTQYQDWAYRVMGNVCEELGYDRSFHSVRHSYAQTRYTQEWQARTGYEIKCPVAVGLFEKEWKYYVKEATGLSPSQIVSLDHDIRLTVSEDLGHGRVSVTAQYLGR